MDHFTGEERIVRKEEGCRWVPDTLGEEGGHIGVRLDCIFHYLNNLPSDIF